MARILAAALGMALIGGPVVAAPAVQPGDCKERIQQIDSLIPEDQGKEAMRQAADRMRVDYNHVTAARAAADAARLAGRADEWTQCLQLAEAAKHLLEAGGWSPRTQD